MSLPTYGLQGGRAQSCAKHAPEGTVDVVHNRKRCEHPGGCMTLSSFGMPGGRARFCVVHMPEGAVYLVGKQCEHEGCPTIPSYGYPGDRTRRFCAKHKPEWCVNVVRGAQ